MMLIMLQAKQEAVEAEKLAKEMGVHNDNDLSALIAKRQNDRKSEMNNFLTNLEEKYAGTSQSKKRKIAKSKKQISLLISTVKDDRYSGLT